MHKYYNQWERITSRHEHWSTPEYIQGAEEKLKKRNQETDGAEIMNQRQTKLAALLSTEAGQFDTEMKERQVKTRQVSNKDLESVRLSLSHAEECRNLSNLESSLYSKLKFDQEKILKESRNTHQAVAKASWLERNLWKSLENQRMKNENNLLELKLEEEKRKHESYIQNCSQMRDGEMSQLKKIQENHIFELKERDRQAHELKLLENSLKKKLSEVQKEITNVDSINLKRHDRVKALHNFRKVKMMMRERSDAVKRDIQHDLNLLSRLSFDSEFDNNEELDYLRLKFQTQHDNESQNLLSIETMYESEAKDSLHKQQKKWDEDQMVREQQIKMILDDRIRTINDKINESIRKQNEMRSLRETHHSAVEECNQRLKDLTHSAYTDVITDENNRYMAKPIIDIPTHTIPDVTHNEFQHDYQLPKFGRKKIPWTWSCLLLRKYLKSLRTNHEWYRKDRLLALCTVYWVRRKLATNEIFIFYTRHALKLNKMTILIF